MYDCPGQLMFDWWYNGEKEFTEKWIDFGKKLIVRDQMNVGLGLLVSMEKVMEPSMSTEKLREHIESLGN
jgi:hypothetical protein